MAFSEIQFMAGMSADQRMLFQSRYDRAQRSRTTALLLTFFLGGLGAHRAYLKQPWLCVLYIIFCWTFIPMFVAFVELFLIGKRVDKFNETQAIEIAASVKGLGAAPSNV